MLSQTFSEILVKLNEFVENNTKNKSGIKKVCSKVSLFKSFSSAFNINLDLH